MVYAFDDVEVDEERLEVRRGGRIVPVQPRVLRLLLFFLSRVDRVSLQDEILAAVWPDVRVTRNALTQAIASIRRTIGDDEGRRLLTVRGWGYRLAGPVRVRHAGRERVGFETPVMVDPHVLAAQADALEARLRVRLARELSGLGVAAAAIGPMSLGVARAAVSALQEVLATSRPQSS